MEKSNKMNEETKTFVMTHEQIRCYETLEFLYNESQIGYQEFKKGLLDIFPAEHIVETKVLTGIYPGHTINELVIKNVENLPDDDLPDDDLSYDPSDCDLPY